MGIQALVFILKQSFHNKIVSKMSRFALLSLIGLFAFLTVTSATAAAAAAADVSGDSSKRVEELETGLMQYLLVSKREDMNMGKRACTCNCWICCCGKNNNCCFG